MKTANCLFGLFCLACSAWAENHPPATITPPEALTDPAPMRLRIAGLGGVYFLAEKGPLNITFYRMQWTDRPEPLRLVLVSPDRQVLLDSWLPEQGPEAGKRPILKTTISCPVPAPGVYGFMLSCPTDRYGLHLRWSFDTNCPRYLIETSGGHKDQRHREPLTMTHYDSPGSVVFWPSKNAFSGRLEQLLRGVPAPRLLDDQGNTVLTLTPNDKHTVDFSLPADAARKAPWSLEFDKMHGVLNLDSLTQWDHSTPFQNLSLWSDRRSAWFDYYTNRALLTPYNLRLNVPAGQRKTADFVLHNNGKQDKPVTLALEYPDGTAPFAELPFTTATVLAGRNLNVPVACQSPAVKSTCRLRVSTADGFTTYSSLTLAPAEADAEYAVPTPLQLTPYVHQNVSCAYYQDYPLETQPYFDLDNQPFIQAGGRIYTRRDGNRWQRGHFRLPDGTDSAVGFLCSKIAFDRDNWVYALINYKKVNYLAYSADHGRNYDLLPVEATGSFDLEQFSGHNLPPGPPPFAVYKMLKNDPERIWRAFFDCRLFIPVKKDGKLSLLPPVTVTDTCIGISLHSGIPSTIASFNGRTFVIWAETTDPADKSIPGVPTRMACYDHATGTLERSPVIGYGPPANDIHNTPCLTIDSKGILHALIGTHGRSFGYAHSLKPADVMGGWTEARLVGENLGQTYLGLVCDKQDNLQMVFRLWGQGPNGLFAQLAMMTKPAGAETWEQPQVLVKAAFNDYSVFYHRFIIDRTGNLYLSFDYWSTYWFYRNDQPRNWRSLIVSTDAGKSWRMSVLDGVKP